MHGMLCYVMLYVHYLKGGISAVTQTSSDLTHNTMCLRGSWGVSFVSLRVLLNERLWRCLTSHATIPLLNYRSVD